MNRWSLGFYAAAAAALLFRCYMLVREVRPADYLYSDMQFNYAIAERIFQGQYSAQDLWKPVGYPLWLAFSFWLNKAGWLPGPHTFFVAANWIFILAIPVLMYFAAEPWLGRARARWVALIGLVHFQFTLFAGIFMVETLFTFVLALMVLLICRSRFPWSDERASLLGILFGTGMILKGQGALFAPLLMIYLFERLPFKRFVVTGGVFALGAALPWSAVEIFKHKNYDSIPGTAVAAMGFVTGKCPGCHTVVDAGGATWGAPVFYQSGNPVTTCQFQRNFSDTKYFWWYGAKCIADHPRVLVSSFSHIYYLFGGNMPWPFSGIPRFIQANRWSSIALSLFLVCGMLAGLYRYFRLKQRGHIPELLWMMAVALMILVYWIMPEIRHRIPFDVFLIPLAVWGLAGSGSPLDIHHTRHAVIAPD